MRESTRPTVIIAFAEALSAPEVAWSLVDAGYRVVGVTRKGRRSALCHSRHVVCHDVCPPETDLQQTIADLRQLLAKEGISNPGGRVLLFPLDDTAVWVCNELHPEDGWLLVGPQGRTAEIALNKELQVNLARESGFNIPTTAVAKTSAEVVAFSANNSYPIILKPVECVPVRDHHKVACGKWICADAAELQHALTQWGERVPLLLQKFIVGVGEGVFGLATPDGIRAWSAHRRLRMMNPQGSGSSACVSQPVREDLKTKTTELVRRAGWRGLFMIELLRDRSGKVWFVELNGRPWGSIALARRQGLEYPAWSVQLTLDEKSQAGTKSSIKPGLVCRNVGREFMHLLFVLRGPRSSALSEWPPVWKSIAAVLHVADEDTFYNWRRDDAGVFFADSYYTIHQNVFKGARG